VKFSWVKFPWVKYPVANMAAPVPIRRYVFHFTSGDDNLGLVGNAGEVLTMPAGQSLQPDWTVLVQTSFDIQILAFLSRFQAKRRAVFEPGLSEPCVPPLPHQTDQDSEDEGEGHRRIIEEC
jgi:hypothetical protein